MDDELTSAMIMAGIKALHTSDLVKRDSREADDAAKVCRIYEAMRRAKAAQPSK